MKILDQLSLVRINCHVLCLNENFKFLVMVLTENTIGFLLQATNSFIGTSINSKYLCVLNKMECTIEEYKRSFCRVFTTFDGNKYIQSKPTEKYIFLKCAIFRTCCKGTSRINRVTNLMTPLREHNHTVGDYMSEIFKLKTKCKSSAKSSQTNLRKVFDDTTRTDPHSCDISFPERKSSTT